MDLNGMSFDQSQEEILLRKYGFNETPFNESADVRFLYLSPAHRNVFYGITKTIDLRWGLAVSLGGYGMGKSSLARLTYSKYLENTKVKPIYLDAQNLTTEFNTLYTVCSAFGLRPGRGVGGQWKIFNDFIVESAKTDVNLVILMDDAQKMTSDSLEFIHKSFNFDVTRKLVQIILFGQPELLIRLKRKPELYDRVQAWLDINPLDLDETIKLINYRCVVAGRNEPIFTSKAFFSIFNTTKGYPRKIVKLSKYVLMQIMSTGKAVADENDVETAIQKLKSAYEVNIDELLL
ncbi:MAG: AAA family ATPase [Anaerolineae bacterium]|nr:AAA family ATPase [Anaerolineae bacterium]